MISKEAVFKYLSEGILSEGWFNFKEDDPQPEQNQDQTQDQDINNQEDPNTQEPNLDWHFYQKDFVLYSGSASEPTSQYYLFADEIRYAEFKKKDQNKNNKDKQDLLSKDFKKNAKNFGLALVSGGLAVASDTVDKAFNDKVDKDKKDKNGNIDKWADAVVDSFSGPNGLAQFKQHAEGNHVPSSLIDEFINKYKELKNQATTQNPENNNSKVTNTANQDKNQKQDANQQNKNK